LESKKDSLREMQQSSGHKGEAQFEQTQQDLSQALDQIKSLTLEMETV
jgi:hypothetical protein